VEIDSDLWQRFLKKLVDIYGSAYGSKKKDAEIGAEHESTYQLHHQFWKKVFTTVLIEQ